jgi:hypothetical protein
MKSLLAFCALLVGALRELNVYRWAGRMLVDSARLRLRERLSGRLTDRAVAVEGIA